MGWALRDKQESTPSMRRGLTADANHNPPGHQTGGSSTREDC